MKIGIKFNCNHRFVISHIQNSTKAIITECAYTIVTGYFGLACAIWSNDCLYSQKYTQEQLAQPSIIGLSKQLRFRLWLYVRWAVCYSLFKFQFIGICFVRFVGHSACCYWLLVHVLWHRTYWYILLFQGDVNIRTTTGRAIILACLC